MTVAGQHGPAATEPVWRLADRVVDLQATRVMGVINVTPDSFSDGGLHFDPGAALARAEEMVAQGAAFIDVGGESTRPGAPEVEVDEELRRVVPVVREIARRVSVPVSVDTTKATVARAALDAGAAVVNDVSGLRADPEMRSLAAESRAGVVLMHMRGSPRTMQAQTSYGDLVGEVVSELRGMVDDALAAGVDASRIVVDPGIGFAKTPEQNLTLLGRIDAFQALGRPVLVGPSRKSFIGKLTGAEVGERLPGTIAAIAIAVLGGARVVRVHDVAEAVQAVAVADAANPARTRHPSFTP